MIRPLRIANGGQVTTTFIVKASDGQRAKIRFTNRHDVNNLVNQQIALDSK